MIARASDRYFKTGLYIELLKVNGLDYSSERKVYNYGNDVYNSV